jgi:hypothetical protein
MFQTATIKFDSGALLLPANDPYEREVVFEQADAYVRRHGAARVQLGNVELQVTLSHRAGDETCSRCGHTLRAVIFTVAKRSFCGHCADSAVRHHRA